MNFTEYMHKDAGIDPEGLKSVIGSVAGIVPYLVAVPLAAGVGAGYMGSKLTSPSAAEEDVLKQEALLTRLKSETGLRERSMLARERLRKLDEELQERRQKTGGYLRI